jgi:tetratricopeptide (TPR) repeat protein
MSLLMKALEKAAQDRDKKPADSASSAAKIPERELELEPVARTAQTPSPPANPKRTDAQARAATVLSAQNSQSPQSAGVTAWLRARPLYGIGALAGLFLLIYAGYVYVQIAHPSLLIKTPAAESANAAANSPAIPVTRNAPTGNALPENPSRSSLSTNSANPSFIPEPSVFSAGGEPQYVQPAAPVASAPLVIPTQPVTPAPHRAAAATPAAPAVPTAPQGRITVNRGDTAAPRVNPVVSEAYAALEAGQFDTAQRLYSQVARSDPTNVDALLGLAAIAQHENRNEDAQRHFLAILDVEPRNALAQSGLIASMGRADPQASETRLKQLLAREPSAPLYFNLGNLYAEQGQWPQAQQAYFQAHNREPRNPDYAYNLAVGLEHLGQQKLALGFYRKALELASAKGGANFDAARIQGRITQLTAQFE